MTTKVLEITSALQSGGIENILYNYFLEKDLFDDFEIEFASHEKNGDVGSKLESLGYKIYYIPPKKQSFIKYLKTLWRIINKNYSIIHVHQSYWSFFPLFIAALKGVRVRIVHNHLAFHNESFIDRVLHRILGFLSIKIATQLWACGEKAGISLYGHKRPFYIMKNAIDISVFSKDLNMSNKIKAELDIKKNSLVLCQIGRFFYQKNQIFTVDILDRLNKLGVDFVCIFLGDGDDRKFIEESIRNNNISDKVRLLGNVQNVQDYLNCVDISLLPSFYEGLPVTVLETQAMGITTYISDKVSKEVCVTNLVQQISIDNADKWVEKIMLYRKTDVISSEYRKQLSENGYDIRDQRRELKKMFIKILTT